MEIAHITIQMRKLKLCCNVNYMPPDRTPLWYFLFCSENTLACKKPARQKSNISLPFTFKLSYLFCSSAQSFSLNWKSYPSIYSSSSSPTSSWASSQPWEISKSCSKDRSSYWDKHSLCTCSLWREYGYVRAFASKYILDICDTYFVLQLLLIANLVCLHPICGIKR